MRHLSLQNKKQVHKVWNKPHYEHTNIAQTKTSFILWAVKLNRCIVYLLKAFRTGSLHISFTFHNQPTILPEWLSTVIPSHHHPVLKCKEIGHQKAIAMTLNCSTIQRISAMCWVILKNGLSRHCRLPIRVVLFVSLVGEDMNKAFYFTSKPSILTNDLMQNVVKAK